MRLEPGHTYVAIGPAEAFPQQEPEAAQRFRKEFEIGGATIRTVVGVYKVAEVQFIDVTLAPETIKPSYPKPPSPNPAAREDELTELLEGYLRAGYTATSVERALSRALARFSGNQRDA